MKEVIKELIEFRDKRNWVQYHTTPELCRALSIEVSELNELFLWGSIPDKERIAEEVADVMIYSIYIAQNYGLDIETIIREKIIKNAKKYPLHQINFDK